MKENQRISITKRLLKEGLLRLLAQKPLDRIRINELCAESGINRTTFYRHYETPRDVLLELEIDFTRQMIPGSAAPASMEEARRGLEYACTYIYEHRDMAKLLFRNNTDTDMMERLNEYYRHYWKLHRDRTQFARLDPDAAKILLALLGGGVYTLLRTWIEEDIPKTPRQIAEIMSNVIRWPEQTDLIP